MASDPTQRFFAGFMRIHILHHAGEGPIYGVEIARELGRHGYRVSYGTLYPVLHSLEKAGLLTSRQVVEGGRRRRVYELTDLGRRTLEELKPKIRELVEEVLGTTVETHEKTTRAVRAQGRSAVQPEGSGVGSSPDGSG